MFGVTLDRIDFNEHIVHIDRQPMTSGDGSRSSPLRSPSERTDRPAPRFRHRRAARAPTAAPDRLPRLPKHERRHLWPDSDEQTRDAVALVLENFAGHLRTADAEERRTAGHRPGG